MRLGATSLSATKPGTVRKYAAASSSSSVTNFKDIDQYSHVRFENLHTANHTCMGAEIHPNGSKIWALQGPSDSDRSLREYNLSTNFDISTASSMQSGVNLSSLFGAVTSFRFKPDGTRLFFAEYHGRIRYYDLSTPWDISTRGSVSSYNDVTGGRISDIIFSPDGQYLYWVDPYRDYIVRRELATAWDTNSSDNGTTNSIYLDYNSTAGMTLARGIFLNNDGTKLYIVCQSSDKIVSYDLSTAYDITSSSFSGTPDSTLSIANIEDNPLGITFDPTGEHMYISGTKGDGVDQFVRN